MVEQKKNNYILAMYDVRGKQDYIFNTTKIKEIIGASAIIRDIYDDYLYDAAEEVAKEMTKETVDKQASETTANVDYKGIFPDPKSATYEIDKECAFTQENFERHMMEGYLGEVIYDGGGNFQMLFKNREVFNRVTHAFTLKVLQATGSLRVIGTGVEIKDFSHYETEYDNSEGEEKSKRIIKIKGDRARLYEAHRITENEVQNVPPYASLPIVMVDPNTAMPVVERRVFRYERTKEEKELTVEQRAKYNKYIEESEKNKNEYDENVLDKIAPEKGVDSHIAVIYIDGNSMGEKVEERTKGAYSYEECIKSLREFSKGIQKEYIDSKKAVIDKELNDIYKDNVKRRIVLGAGDEINMICAGKDAFRVAKAYLNDLKSEEKENYSACAGIAIFKSHMPYTDAYRIAEECCESGKDYMKKAAKDEEYMKDACMLDFHLCQGAIDVSLDQIREHEETTDISRPWLIKAPKEVKTENHYSLQDIDAMAAFLNSLGRSNVKGLLQAARNGNVSLRMELNRIHAHQSATKKLEMAEKWDCINKMDKDKLRKLIYDMVLMYDLWYEETKPNNNIQNGENKDGNNN